MYSEETRRCACAYFGTPYVPTQDKAATRDKGGCFDDTRATYTGEALTYVLSLIYNYGALHGIWNRMSAEEKQKFKDAQRAAADYVNSIDKKNLCNPSDFKVRKR